MKKAKKSPRAIQYLLNADQRLQKISLKRISERLKKRPPRPVRFKNSAGARNSMRFPWPISSRAIVLGVTCVVAAAALITASQSGPRPDVARAADVSMQMTPAGKSVHAPAVQSTAEVQDMAPVTITGCLELDGVTFWLKDTSGVPDTPRSRSWRSGFLKKRPSRVGVVSTANTLKLPNYVGERVAATGVFMNGEMRARSLRRLAASCQ